MPTTSEGAAAIFQQFVPASAATWWAVVESNTTGKIYVVRTSDSGRRWREVWPPGPVLADFLNENVAWVVVGSRGVLWRTLDGGTSWRRLGTTPNGCGQLDFVDELHGWCSIIGAAAMSSVVTLYRTADGGSSWTLVSQTGPLGTSSSPPGALPTSCDKSLTFTSTTLGWAWASFCAAGPAFLYTTEDGGSSWYPLSTVPILSGPLEGSGEGMGDPAVSWPDLAVGLDIGTPHGSVTAIATSSDGGATWQAQLVPGAPKHWSVDLIDTKHWRLTDGTVLLATDDAGVHWRTSKPRVGMKNARGTPLTLQFLSASLGWALSASEGLFIWTRDGGATWRPFQIVAGPLVLPAD